MSLEEIFFVVDTQGRGKKLICAYPSQKIELEELKLSGDLILNEQTDNNTQLLVEEMIQIFLKNREYFALIPSYKYYGFNTNFINHFFSPKKQSQTFQMIIEDKIFITKSVFVKNHGNNGNNDDQVHKTELTIQRNDSPSASQLHDEDSEIQLNSFNIVLMIKGCDNFDELNDYKSFLTFFANGLEYEENQRHFICKNLSRIFSMNSSIVKKIQNLSKLEWLKNTNISSLTQLKQSFIDQINQLQQSISSKFELYQLFSKFYRAIKEQGLFKINELIQFQCSQKISKPIPQTLVDIKPYQTILLKRTLCKILGIDSSSRFEKFISILNPRKSIEEISMQYGFTYSEIQLYASHLIKWQNVWLINPLTNKPSEKKLSDYSEKFDKCRIDFLQTLKQFEVPKSLNTIYEETKLDMKFLIFLIQNSIVTECNTYIYEKQSSTNNEKTMLKNKNISDLEKEYFMLFRKYAFQKKHLHEISWCEDVPLKEVHRCLTLFQDYFGVFYLPNNNQIQ